METAFWFLKFSAKFLNIMAANNRTRRANYILCSRTSGSLSVDGDNRCHNESQSAPSRDTVRAVAVTTLCLTAQNMPILLTPPKTTTKNRCSLAAYLPACRTHPHLFVIIHRLSSRQLTDICFTTDARFR